MAGHGLEVEYNSARSYRVVALLDVTLCESLLLPGRYESQNGRGFPTNCITQTDSGASPVPNRVDDGVFGQGGSSTYAVIGHFIRP
jgi:hypothetical protein